MNRSVKAQVQTLLTEVMCYVSSNRKSDKLKNKVALRKALSLLKRLK